MLTFANPLWLAALVAWGVLTIWLLLVRRPRVDVPFIALWRSNEKQATKKSRERVEAPSVALACALLAIASALVGAAGPRLRREIRGPITIIVDRSVSMGGTKLNEVQHTIAQEFGPGAVDLVELHAPRRTCDRSDWVEMLSPVTGVDLRDELLADVSEAQRTIDHPIIVVSNQPLVLTSALPAFPTPAKNVGITNLTARLQPTPAVMVRLQNDSDFSRAELIVAGVQRDIDLPERGQAKNYFFDLPDSPPVIAADLIVPDENRADDRAWLVRGASNPTIEVRSPVAESVQRVIDVYRKQRPSGASPSRLVVVDDSPRVRGDEIALILETGTATLQGSRRVIDHAVTRSVRDWKSLTHAKTQSSAEGFTPIVSAGDVTLVAVREQPARQVWVGADLTEFARSPDFVVFFARVFDWLSQSSSSDAYHSESVTDDANRWTCLGDLSDPPTTDAPAPGVYRDGDGALHALNAIGITTTQPTSDWKAKLRESARHDSMTRGRVDLSRYFLIAALALVGFAAAFWRGKGGSS